VQPGHLCHQDGVITRSVLELEAPTVDDAAAALRARHLLPVPWVEPVWRTCRATAPHLIDRGTGSIILTSSIAGLRGWSEWRITPPRSTLSSG
jgi:NAD(P)-dependent dehydrogenase (short-subunit alcohol dehydrogenase family)